MNRYSPTRSLFGPTSIAFQLKECLDGQLVKPSWCLLVRTMYLEIMKKWRYQRRKWNCHKQSLIQSTSLGKELCGWEVWMNQLWHWYYAGNPILSRKQLSEKDIHWYRNIWQHKCHSFPEMFTIYVTTSHSERDCLEIIGCWVGEIQ